MTATTHEQEALLSLDHLQSSGSRHTVEQEGCTVCWHRFGDGPPLVLLHGGHGNWMHWVRNIEALAKAHTLWIPDMPGFGESGDLAGEPHAPERLQRLVKVLGATLDALIGPQTAFDLAGFSFGGLVAAHVAVQRPRLRRLALLGTTGHGGPRGQTVELLDWRLPDRAAMRAALRHNLGAFMLHAHENMDALAMEVHERACVSTRFRSKAFSRAAGLEHLIGALSQPVLLLWGEHDVTAAQPAQIARQLADDRTRCEWHVLPAAGHWVQYEAHAQVNALLLQWFAWRPV